MRVLITGGFGYLGGRLAQYLAPDHDIVLGSRRETASPQWLPEARVVLTAWESQINLEEICTGVCAVVHLAGMNAQDCAADPVAALALNGVASGRLLRAAIRKGVKRFVYVSTAQVYDNPLRGVINEETCRVALHPYATSHRAGEDMVRSAHQRKEIEGVVVRLSNSFGAPAEKNANCWTLVINDLCRQAVTTRQMVLHSPGLQRRDFITITDACRAIGHLLCLPADRLADGVFNVGGAWSPTILEVSLSLREHACKILGAQIPLTTQAAEGIGEDAPPLSYRIDKLLNTGFVLTGERLAEINHLLACCVSFFGSGDQSALHRS